MSNVVDTDDEIVFFDCSLADVAQPILRSTNGDRRKSYPGTIQAITVTYIYSLSVINSICVSLTWFETPQSTKGKKRVAALWKLDHRGYCYMQRCKDEYFDYRIHVLAGCFEGV